MNKIFTLLSNAPSFVWVLLLPLGIIAFIGSIIGTFVMLASVEGFASVIMVLVGYGVGKSLAPNPASPIHSSTDLTPEQKKRQSAEVAGSSFLIGAVVCFYALMGMAIDQPGNYFFNKPIEWLLCPTETKLQRGIDVTHPLPGRTDITQNFTCYNTQNQVVGRPDMFAVIGIRFFEYVFIAYGFMGLETLRKKVRTSPTA